MFGHMSAHLGLALPKVITSVVNIFNGVPIFFFLSGYLIFLSLSKQRDWKNFFNKRILRLYPELWICLLFEIFSIIVFYDAFVPIFDYIRFAFTQGTVLQFWTPGSLRGYGCGTPNGSLWTVTVIVQFYILAYLLFNWLQKLNMWPWVILIICFTLYPIVLIPHINVLIPEIAAKLLSQTVFSYLWIFLLGSFVAKFYDRILPTLMRYWYVPFALLLIVRATGFDIGRPYRILGTLLLGLFIIGAAYRYPKLNIKKDISYGVYIYHMIFVNIAIQLGYKHNWNAYWIVAAATLLFAYCSYLTVGGLYRKKKQKISA